MNSIEIEKLIANWTNAIEQMEKVLSDEFAEDIRVLKTCRDQLEQAAREIAARSSERDAVGLQHQVELLMELSICPLHKKHKRFCCDCATELETARDAVRREALEEAAQKCEEVAADHTLPLKYPIGHDECAETVCAKVIRALAASPAKVPDTGTWRCPYCNLDLQASEGVGDDYGNLSHPACLAKVRAASPAGRAEQERK